MSDSIILGKSDSSSKSKSVDVSIPFSTLPLHGLICGSTGTGKSRAIQLMCEGLSTSGISSILADLKGDMSGFLKAGDPSLLKSRIDELGITYSPSAVAADFYSTNDKFIHLRLRLDSIDPLLISRVFKLNSTQESNLKVAFIYAREKSLPIRDLVDLQNVLTYLSEKPESKPGLSSSSLKVILREVSLSIADGLNDLFGEPSLDLNNLLTGKVHVINLSQWRRRSDLPAILMGFILYRIFNELPDVGSLERPKAVLFIDEAHYLFTDSNDSLKELFVTILKQIRSKGVGVFFSTQSPEDLPEKILEQLGCKILFALRAFTKDEMDDIKSIASSFPKSSLDIKSEILSLRIGEAIVSSLSTTGKPNAPLKTLFFPPKTSMGVLSDDEISRLNDQQLRSKYSRAYSLDRYDLLTQNRASSSQSTIRVERHDSWQTENAQAKSYERKEARIVSTQWSKMKWLGFFIVLVLFLLIVLFIVVLFLTQAFLK